MGENKSSLNPIAGVPWGNDDQWTALKAEATRMSIEMERKALGVVGPPRRPGAGAGDGRKQNQVNAMPAGEQARESVFWEPQRGLIVTKLEDNPYEGILGPGIVESSVVQRLHKRGDVSKLIKTPKQVWKTGKPPTQTFAGILPGSHSEIRASQRIPSHLRGLPSRSRTAGAENSEESVGSERKGSVEDLKSTVYTPESVSEYRTRSSSAMGTLQRDSHMTSLSVREGVLDMIGDAEKMETEVFKLRGEYNRLCVISMEKEAELERVRGAQGKVNGQREKADVVDVLLDDFRSRTDTRIEMHDGRLEAIVRHRDALQEVERRLKVVNKGLQYRLLQTKEELRVYVNDIQDMDAMCREVQASRDVLSKQVKQKRQQMSEDFTQRQADVARRQTTVERSMKETHELGVRIKAADEERQKAEADREAEKELARMRALENGTSEVDELLLIRRRKEEGMTGKLQKALTKIYEKANTLSAEGALKYLGDCMKKHSRLVSERERAEVQIDSLRRKDLHSAAARRAAQGGEAEAQDLERMLADIETFGESSRQVADAMRFLVQQYVVFAAGLLAKLVRASEDDMFLRAALRLGRNVPGDGTSDEDMRDWVSRALALIHSTVQDMSDLAKAANKKVSSKQFALPPPPSGPDSDKPLLKSVSGAQSLEVSRKGAGGSQMEILSPHSGFDMAAAIEVD